MSSKRINLKSMFGMRVYVRKTKVSPDEALVLQSLLLFSPFKNGVKPSFKLHTEVPFALHYFSNEHTERIKLISRQRLNCFRETRSIFFGGASHRRHSFRSRKPVVYTVTAVAIPSISKGAEKPVFERFASILAKSESCPGVEIG